jgi:lipid-binding SYLF domain-containing protein
MRTTLLFLCVLMVSSAAGVAISSLANIEGTIYAGTEVNGLYASTDDGIKWAPLNAGIETQEVTSVASQAGYLFAGTFGSGVYRSTDGGQTWMPPLNGGNLAVTAMAVKDSYIFAGSIEEGVYRSSDNGETWAEKLSAFGMGPMCISGNTIFAFHRQRRNLVQCLSP